MQVGTEQSFSAPFVVNLGYGVGTKSLGPGKRKLSFMKFNSLFPELRRGSKSQFKISAASVAVVNTS